MLGHIIHYYKASQFPYQNLFQTWNHKGHTAMPPEKRKKELLHAGDDNMMSTNKQVMTEATKSIACS
jgi:hypothetical protein